MSDDTFVFIFLLEALWIDVSKAILIKRDSFNEQSRRREADYGFLGGYADIIPLFEN